MRPTIFISFTRGDAAAVQTALELRDALAGEATVTLGLPPATLGGAAARRWIEAQIAETQLFALILGRSWAGQMAAQGDDGALFAELAAALARPRNVLPMYTALAGGAAAPTRSALPEALQSLIDTPLAPASAPTGGLGPDARPPGSAVSGMIAALRPEIDRLRREAALIDLGAEETVVVEDPAVGPAPGEAAAARARAIEWAAAQPGPAEAAPLFGALLGGLAGDAAGAAIGGGAGAPPPAPAEPAHQIDPISGADAPPDDAGGAMDWFAKDAPAPDAPPLDGLDADAADVAAASDDDALSIDDIDGKVASRTYGLGREPQRAAALMDAATVDAAAPGAQRGLSAAPALRPATRDPAAAAARLRAQPGGLVGVWMSMAAAGMTAMSRKYRAGARSGGDAAETVVAPPSPEPASDPLGEPVRASLFAPRRAQAGGSFRAQLYLHLAEHLDAVRAEMSEFDPDAARQSGAALSTPIRRGAEVTVQITATDAAGRRAMRVDPARSSVVWRGEPVSAEAFVHVDPGAAPRGYGFVAVVLLNGRPVGELAFLVTVAPALQTAPAQTASIQTASIQSALAVPAGAMGFAPASSAPWSEETAVEPAAAPSMAAAARGYSKIFFSYARADAERVRLVARGFELMDQDFFWDVESLRSGEIWRERLRAEIDRSDVFVLFWSAAARESEMVREELAHALKREAERGAPRILPFPLEGPPPPPPWDELADRHIGDAIYYRSVAAAERAAAASGGD